MLQSSYDRGVDLETRLEDVIHDHLAERRESWESEGADDFLALVDGIAHTLLRAGTSAVLPSWNEDMPSDWRGTRWLAEHPVMRDQVLERVQILVAKDLSLGTHQAAGRCWELTELLLEDWPGQRVVQYIRRLTRCYVAGFSPECVILCRSVLEKALEDRFELSGTPIPRNARGRSQMRTRVNWAVKVGWFTHAEGATAMELWKRGSAAIHGEVDKAPEADALQVIRTTLSLLRSLYDQDG